MTPLSWTPISTPMTLADVAKLLGAAAVLAIVVTVISPPTRPVASPAGDWRKQIPVKTGTAPPASVTGVVPATALSRPPPPAAQPVAPPSLVEDSADQPFDRAAGDGRADEAAARRYHQGYRWAERNDVDDERYCYTEPGDPFTAGCIAWLRDSDDDRGDAFYDDRRDGWCR